VAVTRHNTSTQLNAASNCTLISHCGKILMEFVECKLLRLCDVSVNCVYSTLSMFFEEGNYLQTSLWVGPNILVFSS